jgi:hypothetical protein
MIEDVLSLHFNSLLSVGVALNFAMRWCPRDNSAKCNKMLLSIKKNLNILKSLEESVIKGMAQENETFAKALTSVSEIQGRLTHSIQTKQSYFEFSGWRYWLNRLYYIGSTGCLMLLCLSTQFAEKIRSSMDTVDDLPFMSYAYYYRANRTLFS